MQQYLGLSQRTGTNSQTVWRLAVQQDWNIPDSCRPMPPLITSWLSALPSLTAGCATMSDVPVGGGTEPAQLHTVFFCSLQAGIARQLRGPVY